ncbi:MAG TPA: hypothetical protein VIR62_13195, partial [Allosphingosinicella sp.]
AKLAGFIETLAGCGVVADACRAVGMSVASAYAYRNRRAGRAWGMAWNTVLIRGGGTGAASGLIGAGGASHPDFRLVSHHASNRPIHRLRPRLPAVIG